MIRFPGSEVKHTPIKVNSSQSEFSHEALKQRLVPITTSTWEFETNDPSIVFHNPSNFESDTQHFLKLRAVTLDERRSSNSAFIQVKALELTTPDTLERYPQREIRMIRGQESKLSARGS
jgi:hypothetical protein